MSKQAFVDVDDIENFPKEVCHASAALTRQINEFAATVASHVIQKELEPNICIWDGLLSVDIDYKPSLDFSDFNVLEVTLNPTQIVEDLESRIDSDNALSQLTKAAEFAEDLARQLRAKISEWE